MTRNLEQEKHMDNYPCVDKGYIVFFGDNEQLRCRISVERLKILWNSSWFYRSWLKRANPEKNGVYIGRDDRNLDLIIEYMNGKPIYLDLKSRQELEELKEDFEFYEVKTPSQLLKKLSVLSTGNNDSNGPIDDIKFIKKEITNMNNNMETMNRNIVQLLTKMNRISDENNELRNEMKKIEKDSDELKNTLKQQNDTQMKCMSLIKQDTDQIKNIKNDINQIVMNNSQLRNDSNIIKDKVEELVIDYQLLTANSITIMNDVKSMNTAYNEVKDIMNNSSRNMNLVEQNIVKEIKVATSSESSMLYKHNQICNSMSYSISKNTNFVNSVILNGNSNYINTLNNWLGNEKQWKLLFRASEYNYSASEFHKYCDHKCPTVTIIKHIGHDNKINIFGGYTTQYWESRSDDNYKFDSGSFLFTLSNEHNIPPTKYDILKPTSALYCYKDSGPNFFNMSISDYCHNNNNSYVNGNNDVYSHILTPQFRSLFTNTAGREEFNYFTVDEYEVYELIPNPYLYLPNSYLITKEMGIEISKWFKGNKQWKLLYRCSDENRSIKKWHEKCDDKESLVIIQGKRKDGQSYIFGGYTSVGWGKNHIDDTRPERKGVGWRIDSKAFLFSLTNPHGYNYTKLNVNPKRFNNALMSNDPNAELSFCRFLFLVTQKNQDRFTSVKIHYMCEDNPEYIHPYPELGSSFFIDTNKPNERNEFDLIDFEVFTSN
ncbi:hypothetical protein WA158_004183 [Blastocystis sp. Blastoise]